MESTPSLIALEQLLKSYEAFFNVSWHEPSEAEPWQAEADYFSRDEKYVLTKKATMWAAESNEFAYFFAVEKLDLPLFKQLRDQAVYFGFRRVQPHSEHMCTNISLLFVAEQVSKEASSALVAERLRKNYKLTIHGWSELRLACLDLSTNSIFSNRAGADLRPQLNKTVQRLAELPGGYQPQLAEVD